MTPYRGPSLPKVLAGLGWAALGWVAWDWRHVTRS